MHKVTQSKILILSVKHLKNKCDLERFLSVNSRSQCLNYLRALERYPNLVRRNKMAAERLRPHTFQQRMCWSYDDREFIKLYRLDHKGILFVTDLVRNSITSYTLRNNAWNESNNDFAFFGDWKNAAVYQPWFGPFTVHNKPGLKYNYCTNHTKHKAIHWLQYGIIRQKQAIFMRIVGFLWDVGAIDGTHVCIIAPTVYEETYMNRKVFHSINVQWSSCLMPITRFWILCFVLSFIKFYLHLHPSSPPLPDTNLHFGQVKLVDNKEQCTNLSSQHFIEPTHMYNHWAFFNLFSLCVILSVWVNYSNKKTKK